MEYWRLPAKKDRLKLYLHSMAMIIKIMVVVTIMENSNIANRTEQSMQWKWGAMENHHAQYQLPTVYSGIPAMELWSICLLATSVYLNRCSTKKHLRKTSPNQLPWDGPPPTDPLKIGIYYILILISIWHTVFFHLETLISGVFVYFLFRCWQKFHYKQCFSLQLMDQLWLRLDWSHFCSIRFTTEIKLKFKGHTGKKRPGFQPLPPLSSF